MKKFLFALAGFLLTMLISVNAFAATGRGVITASSLTLRKGAGTSYAKLTAIPKGKTISITASTKDSSGTTWYKTTYSGKTGYVSGSYVTFTPTSKMYTVKKSGGKYYSYLDGKKASYTGFVYAKINNKTAYWYFKSGIFQSAQKGFVETSLDGVTGVYYVGSGQKATCTKLMTYNGALTYIKAGRVDLTYTGFATTGSKWYYCVKGVAATSKSGFISGTVNGTSGYWYCVKGLVQTSKNGFVKSSVDGTSMWTWVKNGRIDTSVTGLKKGSPKLLYMVKGRHDTSYTGFAKYDSSWYYVVKGLVDFKYSGEVKGKVDGETATWVVEGSKVIEKAFTPCRGIITGIINMRGGVGTSYSIVYTFDKIVYLSLTDREKDSSGVYWYKTTYSGHTGWISGKYVTLFTNTDDDYIASTSTTGIATINTSSVTVYQGPGTKNKKLGTITDKTAKLTLYNAQLGDDGAYWFRMTCGSLSGYVKKSELKITFKTNVKSDSDFEAYLTAQGFPESYKKQLRLLHEKYPNWKFVANYIDDDFTDVVNGQYAFGSMLPAASYGTWSGTRAISIIGNSEVIDAWKSKDADAYKNGSYVTGWDGDYWVIPHKDIVKYYLDPRNFLDENHIFQFLSLEYESYQTAAAIKSAAVAMGSSWLSKNYTHTTDNTTINYPNVLATAGKTYGINPISLVSIITQELGTEETALTRNQISGTCSGYKGYYNYYNIGAYVDSNYSKAYLRALATAKGTWTISSITNFPWNTRAKAIHGGAQYFANSYIKNNQYTLYYKKFNVINGNNQHQFSTAIQSADSEGKLLKKAYTDDLLEKELTFYIPVYSGMPSTAAGLP